MNNDPVDSNPENNKENRQPPRRKKRLDFTPDRGIRGEIVLDEAGLPIRTDFSPGITAWVATRTISLIEKIRTFVECLDEGSVHFIKLETSYGEILVVPEISRTLIMVQGSFKRF